MIFAVKNEDGISTCDLVLQGKKTVTRRLKGGRIYEVGKDYAVQPSRAKKSVARIIIISSMSQIYWCNKFIDNLSIDERKVALEKEAKKEGFGSWKALVEYFWKNKIITSELVRYEFKLLKEE